MNFLYGLIALIVIGFISVLVEGNWHPSEGLVRSLVLGAFMGLVGGVILILRSLWRKYSHREPVQRL